MLQNITRRRILRAALLSFGVTTELASSRLAVLAAPADTYFVDSNAEPGGDGSLQAPWHDFTQLQAL